MFSRLFWLPSLIAIRGWIMYLWFRQLSDKLHKSTVAFLPASTPENLKPELLIFQNNDICACRLCAVECGMWWCSSAHETALLIFAALMVVSFPPDQWTPINKLSRRATSPALVWTNKAWALLEIGNISLKNLQQHRHDLFHAVGKVSILLQCVKTSAAGSIMLFCSQEKYTFGHFYTVKGHQSVSDARCITG